MTFVDEGFYACVVGNEVANVKAGAYLTVEDPKIVPMNPQSQKPLVFVSFFLDSLDPLHLEIEI